MRVNRHGSIHRAGLQHPFRPLRDWVAGVKESTERKIRVIYAGWSNGNNKDTAKLIRSLSKQDKR